MVGWERYLSTLMNAAINSLVESFQKDEPHTDEEYEAVCKMLIDSIKRNLDGAEEDHREIRRLRDETRAAIESIRSMPPIRPCGSC